MNKKHIVLTGMAAVFAAAMLMLASCSQKDAWNTDFDTAKNIAEKKNKNIFLLFSGEDWDEHSAALKASVLNTKEFKKQIAPSYVLAVVELSQSEYARTVVDNSATEEQKKEAERLTSEYAKKEALLQQYYVESFPAMYILSPEGYVLATVPYSETLTSVQDLSAQLESQQEIISTVSDAIATAKKASGTDKAVALDALYELTQENFRPILTDVVSEIPALDPENVTGLVGKYELINGYAAAIEKLMKDNDIDGAVRVFTGLCDSSNISNAQKQEALYTAAFMLARTGSQDYDTMTSLLEQAIAFEPENDIVKEIETTIQAIQDMKKKILEMQAGTEAPAGNS